MPKGDLDEYGQVMSLTDEKYLLLTTYRKSGEAISSPVWTADLGNGTVGFWTSSGSGKAKRLAHTQKVIVQGCDTRGKLRPGTQPVETTARIVTGTELDLIRQKVRAKYGLMTTISKWLNTIGGIVKRRRIPYGDRGVVITIPS